MDGKLSVVIPCYNAENNIKNVIKKDIEIFENLGICDYEFVLVNDCSKDSTWSVIKELASVNPRITSINLAKNCGQHSAIMAGFHYVSGDYAVVSDDDGQTQMEMIGVLLDKMSEGYDIVTTKWTKESKKSLIRSMGSKLNDKMNEWLLGEPKDVVMSIFFAAKKFIIDEIIKYDNPYPYLIGLLLRTSHNIGTVEVEQLERQSGTSGYSYRKLIALWLNGFTAFSIVPLRVASYIGVFSAAVGFIYGLIIIIRKILFDNIATGWGSTLSVMLFMFGITLCVLGMIGEYIGRIYICINNTPQYVIKDIEIKRE